jgi:hypothetical protein
MSEIDSFLDAFDRVRTAVLEEYGWGDAFYIRKGKYIPPKNIAS